jgi:hypothetical protein
MPHPGRTRERGTNTLYANRLQERTGKETNTVEIIKMKPLFLLPNSIPDAATKVSRSFEVSYPWPPWRVSSQDFKENCMKPEGPSQGIYLDLLIRQFFNSLVFFPLIPHSTSNILPLSKPI